MSNGQIIQKNALLSVHFLRAFAALTVVLFHAFEFYFADFRVTSNFHRVLAVGVDVFFVLSGIVIVKTTFKDRVSIASFVEKRLIRVLPLYWITTLVWVALVFFSGGAHELGAGRFIRSLLLIPSHDGDLFLAVHPAGWTLCYEMVFYAVVAALLLYRSAFRRTVAIMVVIAAGVLGRVFGVLPDLPYFSTIMLEFVAGCALGLYAVRNRGSLSPLWSGVIAAVAIAWLLVFGTDPGDRFLSWGIPATLFVFALLNLELRRGIADNKLLNLLGDASYSIYLWHLPAFVVTALLVRPITGSEGVLFVARLILGVGGGIVLYLLLERPLTARLRSLASLGKSRMTSSRVPG